MSEVLRGYICCRVCGKVFELDRLVCGGAVGYEFVPTEARGHFVVCRFEISDCRGRLEHEINRLVREEGYQGFYTFGETSRGPIHE